MLRQRPRSARALRLQKVAHYMTGAILLLKGFAKLDHPEGNELVIAVAFAGGISVFLTMLFHDAIARRLPRADAPIHCVEGLVCAVVGITEFRHGAAAIHIAWLLAAAMLLVLGIGSWFSGTAHHQHVTEAGAS